MIAPCPICGAMRGPGEVRFIRAGCLTCTNRRARSLRDRALAILEDSPIPLPAHDVQRHLEVGTSRRINAASLKVQLAQDRERLCWAGPGSYGLYRHGLLPGVRTLAEVGGVYLLAHGAPLTVPELTFVLKQVGYRFREGSLRNAMLRGRGTALLQTDGWGSWTTGSSTPANREAARAMGLGSGHGQDYLTVLARAGEQARDALQERAVRLQDVRSEARR